jgi:EcsC protein family
MQESELHGYERQALIELQRWQGTMLREPGMLDRMTTRWQSKVNGYIPERVHRAVTAVIKQMTRGVLEGSNLVVPPPLTSGDLRQRETLAAEKIDVHRRMAAAEGGFTGAGGFLLGLADFPLLLSIKLKLLFEIAACYGYSGAGSQERIYVLRIMQLAFSSDAHRRAVYLQMLHWDRQSERLPNSLAEFEWREFQQEYRNYIDLAKLAQLLPIVGAPVGFVVNSQLLKKLGSTAIQAYRMRWFAGLGLPQLTQPRGLPDISDTHTGANELSGTSRLP